MTKKINASVSEDAHRKLTALKRHLNLGNVDAVIEYLIGIAWEKHKGEIGEPS